MAKDEHNPYYAYVSLDIGNFHVDSKTTGAFDTGKHSGNISMQATYLDESNCTFVVEVYDDVATEVVNAILYNGHNVDIEYGYSEGGGIKAVDCTITAIHSQLVGFQGGEILTLELVPTYLNDVMNSSDDTQSKDQKLTGTPSEILRKVIAQIGWQEGIIYETQEYRGDNNGNDDLANPEHYMYWSAEMPATEFMQSLTQVALTTETEPRGNFILSVEYNKGEKPVVNFLPAEDLPTAKEYEYVYGDPDSQILEFDVDWGTALLSHAGMGGIISRNQDSITNLESECNQNMGVEVSEVQATSAQSMRTPTTRTGNLRKLGRIAGPQAEETWYNLNMDKVVRNMASLGYTPDKGYYYHVREDGVKMLGDYVMVAADVSGNYVGEAGYAPLYNHVGRYNKGDIVETSQGQGIVVDACRAACDLSYDQFDVAVSWTRGG